MTYINTSNGVSIYINNQDYTQYLIQGSLSDTSVYSNNVITTTGEIVLGTTETILDFDKSSIPVGSEIKLYVKLDDGRLSRHPKGTLYVIDSSSSVEELTLTLEVGCCLAFLQEKESQYADAVRDLFQGLITSADKKLLNIEEYSFSTLNAYLDCLGLVFFQDRYGNVQKLNVFGNSSGSNKLTSYDTKTAIAIESLSATSVETDISEVRVDTSVDVPVQDIDETSPGDDDDDDDDDLSLIDGIGQNPSIDSVTHAFTVAAGGYVNFTVQTSGIAEGGLVSYRVGLKQSALSSARRARLPVDANGQIQFSIGIASNVSFDTVKYPDSNTFFVQFFAHVKLEDPGPNATPEEQQDYAERISRLMYDSGDITITGFTELAEEDGESDNFVPEPFISTILFRTVPIPRVFGGYLISEEKAADAALTDNSNPLTGTIDAPVVYEPPNQLDYARDREDVWGVYQLEFPPTDTIGGSGISEETKTGVGYSWHVAGEIGTDEEYVEERVVSGRDVFYNPYTKQLSQEYTFEWASGATYAKEANENSAKIILDYIGFAAERVDNLLQKANQCFDERDKFTQEVTYNDTQYANSTWYYWQFQAEAYFNEAEVTLNKLNRLKNSLATVLTSNLDNYYITGGSTKVNRYNKYTGNLDSEKVVQYVHPLKVPNAKSYEITIRSGFAPTHPRKAWYSDATTVAVETINNLAVEIFENPESKLNMPAPSNGRAVSSAFKRLAKASETFTEYFYFKFITVKKETFIDFFDGTRNYSKISYSSTGSTSPELPDRIGEEPTAEDAVIFDDVPIGTPLEPLGGGQSVFPNPHTIAGGSITTPESTGTTTSVTPPQQYCTESTEPHEISVNVKTSISSSSVVGQWWGSPTMQIKKTSFPLEFMPIRSKYDPATRLCDLTFNPSSILAEYEKIVKRYAINLAKKIRGDNSGFRVTEKMRAEIFGYYPYYPITVSLQSLGKSFKTRAASSTWVFNQQESICSFDCLTISKTTVPVYPTETSVADSLEDLYPAGAIVVPTATNYFADAGDLDANTSSGGFDGDAGEFDTPSVAPGISYLEAGDFDTGTTVTLPPPSNPPSASTTNGDTDPETEMGVELEDETGATVDVDTLPTVTGPTVDLLPIDIPVTAILDTVISFTYTTKLTPTWNFGTILVELSSEYDGETITSPNTTARDFGTITTPLVPVISSYVI